MLMIKSALVASPVVHWLRDFNRYKGTYLDTSDPHCLWFRAESYQYLHVAKTEGGQSVMSTMQGSGYVTIRGHNRQEVLWEEDTMKLRTIAERCRK